ncbi:protein of unknown function [Nitrosotalea devaniterrae]|uniref:Uncharacterized protein n=1 Tax=Nitrosotalea devaniterrae TaxID=1078905 RepID=A0A128A507_9ARCH|nr:protein of unknown function [Candidatus Nitrosotalea devanaterra]
MKVRYVIIIPAIVIVAIVVIITVINENPFMPENLNDQLIRLALSDSRVKHALDDKHYHVEIVDSFVKNYDPRGTDITIQFYFDDGSYIQVRENNLLHEVIDVQNGTKYHL